ncbi:hypothetical protein T12_2652 [Trichinella patagoniensis]|uniref:Uncharacterized protein n=1 Tax=Trichinella patagoniensis TaxID=990121 RepID=A0A0V1AGE6_9BILA|nr:hypothetical protein T12_2652 [Trichinella patagoniensis]
MEVAYWRWLGERGASFGRLFKDRNRSSRSSIRSSSVGALSPFSFLTVQIELEPFVAMVPEHQMCFYRERFLEETEGFVSPARAEFISALKWSSSDSPYRSRRRRFNVSYGAYPARSYKSSTSGATESAQTELPLARTIDADYVAKKTDSSPIHGVPSRRVWPPILPPGLRQFVRRYYSSSTRPRSRGLFFVSPSSVFVSSLRLHSTLVRSITNWMVSAASIYRSIPPKGGTGVAASYAAALIRCPDGPSVTAPARRVTRVGRQKPTAVLFGAGPAISNAAVQQWLLQWFLSKCHFEWTLSSCSMNSNIYLLLNKFCIHFLVSILPVCLAQRRLGAQPHLGSEGAWVYP